MDDGTFAESPHGFGRLYPTGQPRHLTEEMLREAFEALRDAR